jgi:hypothetical protein
MSWKPIEEHIKDALKRLDKKYQDDVRSGRKKPMVAVEDYIDEHGIRVRRYEKQK